MAPASTRWLEYRPPGPAKRPLSCLAVQASPDGSQVTCQLNYAPQGTPSGTVVITVTITGGGNLLTPNQSGFESGNMTGWTPVADTAIAATSGAATNFGSYAGWIQAGPTTCAMVTTNKMPIDPTQKYKFGMTYKPRTTVRSAVAVLQFYDSSGTPLSNPYTYTFPETAGGWSGGGTGFSAPPATAATVTLSISYPGAVQDEGHYVDNLSVTASTDVVLNTTIQANSLAPPIPINPNVYCSTPRILTLTIGANTVDLMDSRNGFRVSELDIGYPDVREDVDLRADQHGTVDMTRLFGARAITITGSIVPSAYGSRQKTWHQLAPFLNPAARPTPTWQVDGDVNPRSVTIRPSDVSGPYSNPLVSAFHIGFKASDPLMYDSTVQIATAYANNYAAGAGRQYSLVFDRVYPPAAFPSVSVINQGDTTAYPKILLYGPATGPALYEYIAGVSAACGISFLSTFILGAGNYVEINCRTRTVFLNGDPGNSVYNQLSNQTSWPYLPPGVITTWQLFASGTSNATQAQIQWQNAYLI